MIAYKNLLNRLLSVCLFLSLMLVSVSCNSNSVDNEKANSGQVLFEDNCTLCHGKDGKLMAAGAPDLTKSVLSPEATLSAIENGSPQKGMPAYGKRLKKEELEKLRDYVTSLRIK